MTFDDDFSGQTNISKQHYIDNIAQEPSSQKTQQVGTGERGSCRRWSRASVSEIQVDTCLIRLPLFSQYASWLQKIDVTFVSSSRFYIFIFDNVGSYFEGFKFELVKV